MSIKLVAVVRRSLHVSSGSIVCSTSVSISYPDGRDCGVPMFVEGYEGASALLMKFGVSYQDLEKNRRNFEKDAEVRIPLAADESVVIGEGFNPRE